MNRRRKLRVWATRSRRAKSCGGNTLTEFALILPFLLAGIFGVIEFGRALYAYHFVSAAAREASRWASVRGQGCDAWAQACPASAANVKDYVTSIAPPGINTDSQTLLVNTLWVTPPGKSNPCRIFQNNPGCAVQVVVTYQFKFILPFMPKSTYSMKSTSEMVISR
jgi:Flp pilus assembly protein TadG